MPTRRSLGLAAAALPAARPARAEGDAVLNTLLAR